MLSAIYARKELDWVLALTHRPESEELALDNSLVWPNYEILTFAPYSSYSLKRSWGSYLIIFLQLWSLQIKTIQVLSYKWTGFFVFWIETQSICAIREWTIVLTQFIRSKWLEDLIKSDTLHTKLVLGCKPSAILRTVPSH